ncbi:RluA family pseudouridine synthase [Lachnospiraceae bacterium MD329]|nr:RluA family pseudouridine synthase [Lachnospiraceae bacterium MD329]
MDRILEYKVISQYDGENVKTVLKQHFKMSTALIKELKKYKNGIQLNGEHIRVVDTVTTGDMLRVTIRDTASENIIPKNIPIDIVYEDEDILVIDKPPYMPTHPSMGNYENSVANGVMYYFKTRGENRVFRAVNRLDKDTSGLMTIAKNAYIHARLGEEIGTGELRRKYDCIVCGDIDGDGTVDAPIKRADCSVINRIVSEDGQRAVTHYKVLERYGKYTLLSMELETGRTHQIRVHMAHIGHPLAGDWLYGTEDKQKVPRQMLHSCYLRFIHPITNREMVFDSKYAQDMSEFIQKILEKNA